MVKEQYHHGALKETLVKEAFAVLESQGMEALSLRDLAEKAGVSKNAPYRHFASRHDLLAALAADGFSEFANTLELARDTVTSQNDLGSTDRNQALLVLRALGKAYVAFAHKRPACYRLMFSELGYSLHSESCKSNSMRAFGTLVQAVHQANALGWRSGEDAMGLSLLIWSTLHGWACIRNDNLLPQDLQGAQNYPLVDLLFPLD